VESAINMCISKGQVVIFALEQTSDRSYLKNNQLLAIILQTQKFHWISKPNYQHIDLF